MGVPLAQLRNVVHGQVVSFPCWSCLPFPVTERRFPQVPQPQLIPNSLGAAPATGEAVSFGRFRPRSEGSRNTTKSKREFWPRKRRGAAGGIPGPEEKSRPLLARLYLPTHVARQQFAGLISGNGGHSPAGRLGWGSEGCGGQCLQGRWHRGSGEHGAGL